MPYESRRFSEVIDIRLLSFFALTANHANC